MCVYVYVSECVCVCVFVCVYMSVYVCVSACETDKQTITLFNLINQTP